MLIKTLLCVVACCSIIVHYCSCQSLKEHKNKKHGTENKRKLIDDLLKDYDKVIAPSNNGHLLVRLQFYILEFSDINELSMDFTLSYFIMVAWTDERLQFRPEYYDNISVLNVHPEQMGEIWRPDIFYRNERGESISKSFSLSNSASKIFPSGEVQFVRKLESKFQCQLKFQNYPFDMQNCHLYIGSIAFTADLLKFGFFNSELVLFNSEIELTSFELLGVGMEESNRTLDSGIYHQVKITFKF